MTTEAIREARRRLDYDLRRWPDRHVADPNSKPVPFHLAQDLTYESTARIVGMLAGSQGGKTGFGPWWLEREIELTASPEGNNDYLAITATFDLFKLKMLPALIHALVDTLGIARYWGGDRILELMDPRIRSFWAHKASDPMWGRIILRSADSLGGLESATAKGAWLDECGQYRFTHDAYKATRRRIALHRGRALLTTTLYDVGWIDSEVIDRAKHGGSTKVIEAGEGEIEITTNEETNTEIFQFDSIINPLFPMEEFEEARDTMPDEEFQAFYRGRRVASRLMIYDCWDEDLNTRPRFEIPSEWPRWMGLDFGPVNTIGLYLAEEPESDPKKFYLYRIYHAGGRTGKQHAESILDGEPGRPYCIGGSKSESNWRLEFRSGGLPVREPKIADVGLQISMTYAAIKQRRLIVFDDLLDFFSDLQKYRYKRDRQGSPTEQIENESQRHIMAALRYIGSQLFKKKPKAKVRRIGE